MITWMVLRNEVSSVTLIFGRRSQLWHRAGQRHRRGLLEFRLYGSQ